MNLGKQDLLQKIDRLHSGLVQLLEIRREFGDSRGSSLRSDLNILWGEIGDQVEKIMGVHMMRTQHREFPTMTTALSAVSEGIVRGNALRFATEYLETAIGKISSLPDSTFDVEHSDPYPNIISLPPDRRRFPWWLLLVGLAFVAGKYDSQIIAKFYSPEGIRSGRVVVAVAVIVANAICGNLLASLIHEHGWIGSFSKRPVAVTVYWLVALGGAALVYLALI